MISVVSNDFAFAAIQDDRTLRAWGLPAAGGELPAQVADASRRHGVAVIKATAKAFAAILEDGTVVAWGDSNYGGDASGVQSELTGIVNLYSNEVAFVAVKDDGSIRAWGPAAAGGDVPSFVSRFCPYAIGLPESSPLPQI